MKKTSILKFLVGITLAASAAFAVGSALNSKKAELTYAADYSGRIFVQKNDNDMKYTGSKLVAYFFDNNSHNAWGSAVQNDGHTYQVYTWTLNFEPTTIIMLRVNGSWSENNPWTNIYCRTGNVSLSGADVLWMKGDSGEYTPEKYGTYSMETTVVSDSGATLASLDEYKVANGGESLEAFGEVNLSANQKFYIKKTIDGDAKYNNYTCLDLISSNLKKSGDYIQVTNAADYEFYFDFNGKTLYITDPVIAAADEWAQDFLENVGCDPTGATAPSGWAGEVSRYNSITDGRVKDKIYSATANRTGTYLEQAVYWYDYAIAAHPELTKFIKNSSNVVRASNVQVGYGPFVSNSQNTNTIAIIVIISLVSVTAIGGFFFIRKRKEN